MLFGSRLFPKARCRRPLFSHEGFPIRPLASFPILSKNFPNAAPFSTTVDNLFSYVDEFPIGTSLRTPPVSNPYPLNPSILPQQKRMNLLLPHQWVKDLVLLPYKHWSCSVPILSTILAHSLSRESLGFCPRIINDTHCRLVPRALAGIDLHFSTLCPLSIAGSPARSSSRLNV